MISIAVAAVAFDQQGGAPPGVWLLPIALAVTVMAADELYLLLSGQRPPLSQRWQNVGVTTVTFAVASLPIWYPLIAGPYPPDCPVGRAGWLGLSLVAGSLLWFLHEVYWFNPEESGRATRIAVRVLLLIYPTLLLATAVLIRQMGEASYGLSMVVSVIAVSKMSDSGAYFGGRSWGRRPLAPALSPKKTVEGAVAGMVTGLVASWVYFAWIAPACFGTQPITGAASWRSLAYGVAIVLAAMAGDLFESLLKRDAQIKDSSAWLPGLGGILDTIDSLLFAFPVAYALTVLDWSGTGGQ